MKKILFIALAAAMTMGVMSCNKKSESATPLVDSASTTMGEFMGTMIAGQMQQDSTMDMEQVIKGIELVMNADTSNHSYLAGIQIGMQVMQQMQMVKQQGGFDLNREVMMDALLKALRNTDSVKPEQAMMMQQRISDIMERASKEVKEKDPANIETKKAGEAFLAKKAKEGYTKTKSGLLFKVLAPGAGENFTEKDIIMTKYEGKHIDGTVFDDGQGQPAPFSCAPGQLIPGVSEMLKMMKPGMKVEVIVPSDLAYGINGNAVIKPNETLIFVLETIEVKKAEAPDGRQVPVEAVAQ